jgi:hypothetical protein
MSEWVTNISPRKKEVTLNMNAKTTVGTAAVLLVLVFLGLGAVGSGSASLLSIKYPDKNPDVQQEVKLQSAARLPLQTQLIRIEV